MNKNNSVYKFPLYVEESNEIKMPKGAEVLAVQMQGDRPMVWALCDNGETEQEIRKFFIAGTGHEADFSNKKYIGTVQEHGGILVWHLFEIIK